MSGERVAEQGVVLSRLQRFYFDRAMDAIAQEWEQAPEFRAVYHAAVKCRVLVEQLEDVHAELLAASKAARS